MKQRLDQKLVELGLIPTRSQAESYIKLGDVKLNGKVVMKPGAPVGDEDKVELTAREQYVSRAALKLASVTKALRIDFEGKTILDVGSSTGGFTDYALKHGATKSIAVDVGTNQMHPLLQNDPRIELHEQTDIRDFITDQKIDIVVADVSFISLREILPHVTKLANKEIQIVAMVKPQFEAVAANLKHKGVIKNDRMRRDILKDFEAWANKYFVIVDKADSQVSGSKGNVERFYLLKVAKTTAQ
jgi:23S rRNA (cytidine1920-2'-O)/16S rRNA (cytidine1409-2'-O)-methyltransferase